MEEEFPNDMYLPRGLCVKTSSTNDKKLGIYSNITIKAGVKYGPFRGEKKEILDVLNDDFAFLVRNTSGRPLFFVDAFDVKSANWMRFVKFTELKYNLTIFQKRKKIFFKVSKDIYPNDELLIRIPDKLDQVKREDEMICDSTIEIDFAHHADLPDRPLTISDNAPLSTNTSDEVNVSCTAISLKRSYDNDDSNNTDNVYNSNAQKNMTEDAGTDESILEIDTTSSFDGNAQEIGLNGCSAKIVSHDEPLNKVFKSYVYLKQIDIPEEMKAELEHVLEPDNTTKLQKTMHLEAGNINTNLTNECLSLVENAMCNNKVNSLDLIDQLTIDGSNIVKEDDVKNIDAISISAHLYDDSEHALNLCVRTEANENIIGTRKATGIDNDFVKSLYKESENVSGNVMHLLRNTKNNHEEPLDLRFGKGVKNIISDNKNNNSELKNQESISHNNDDVQKINENNLKRGFERVNYSTLPTIKSHQVSRNLDTMNVQLGIKAGEKNTTHGPCQSRQDNTAVNEMRNFTVKKRKHNPCSQYTSETSKQIEETQNQTKSKKKTFRCWICNISFDSYDTYLNHVMVSCRLRVGQKTESLPSSSKFVPACKPLSSVVTHSNVTPIITSVKSYSTDFMSEFDMHYSGTLMRLASIEKLKSNGIIQNNMLKTTLSNSSTLMNSYTIGGSIDSRNIQGFTGRPMTTVFPDHYHHETPRGPLCQNQIILPNVRSLSNEPVNKNINFQQPFIRTQKPSGNLTQVNNAVRFNHDLPIKQLQQRNAFRPSVASFSPNVPQSFTSKLQPRPPLLPMRFLQPQEKHQFGPLSRHLEPACPPSTPFHEEPRRVTIPPPENESTPWCVQSQFFNGNGYNSEFNINRPSHPQSKKFQKIKITLPSNKFGGYRGRVPKLLPLGRFPISLNKNLNDRRYTM